MQNTIYQSWDTAIKCGNNNDQSVCTTWEDRHGLYYLLDVFCIKAEYPDLKRSILSLANKWQPIAILIEDKASGQSLIQDIKQESDLRIIAINPVQDKISRFAAVTAIIEAGKVFLPQNAPWLADYESQITNFPHAPHDDMVDSTSQFLNWVRSRQSSSKPSMRSL